MENRARPSSLFPLQTGDCRAPRISPPRRETRRQKRDDDCRSAPLESSNRVLTSRRVLYLERGRTSHLASGNGKSHTRALAVRYFLVMVFAMKTDASQTVTDDVQAYVQLQRQMHEALLREHPEWVEPNGECPMCEAYESRLAELLGLSSHSEHRSAA